jgi:hypothetical protein
VSDSERPDERDAELDSLRSERSFFLWLFTAVWFAGGAVAAYLVEADNPVSAWYEWPLLWVGTTFFVGLALIVLMMVVVPLHDQWWRRYSGDAQRRWEAEQLDREVALVTADDGPGRGVSAEQLREAELAWDEAYRSARWNWRRRRHMKAKRASIRGYLRMREEYDAVDDHPG